MRCSANLLHSARPMHDPHSSGTTTVQNCMGIIPCSKTLRNLKWGVMLSCYSPTPAGHLGTGGIGELEAQPQHATLALASQASSPGR